jgi:adenylate cyclase class 2
VSPAPANAALWSRRFELKARDADPARTAAACRSLGAQPGAEVIQRDTYFQGPRGRLRVRQEEGGGAQLYADERNVHAGQASRHWLFDLGDPEALVQAFTTSLGVEAVVVKERRLLFWEGLRIHLDDVRGLGHFIELQSNPVDKKELRIDRAKSVAVRHAFGLEDIDLIDADYRELVLAAPQNATSR